MRSIGKNFKYLLFAGSFSTISFFTFQNKEFNSIAKSQAEKYDNRLHNSFHRQITPDDDF